MQKSEMTIKLGFVTTTSYGFIIHCIHYLNKNELLFMKNDDNIDYDSLSNEFNN